eukprot:GHUV01016231.1.p1 GENE.GHUV01016231.1~~GHUV01016231.1.p1  ORF type:complete len:524 (+),score=159.58 GHUV01016231.1:608-2179(+)
MAITHSTVVLPQHCAAGHPPCQVCISVAVQGAAPPCPAHPVLLQEQRQQNHAAPDVTSLPSQTTEERVAAVRPMWEQLHEQERMKLLTVSLDKLRQQAEMLDKQSIHKGTTGNPSDTDIGASDLLAACLIHLRRGSNLKVFTADGVEAYNPDDFLDCMYEDHIPTPLQDCWSGTSNAAGAAAEALHNKLCKALSLLEPRDGESAVVGAPADTVAAGARKVLPPKAGVSAAQRQQWQEQILCTLTALEKEHTVLRTMLLSPICTILKDHTEGAFDLESMELHYDDLNELSTETPGEVRDWLRQQLIALINGLHPEGAGRDARLVLEYDLVRLTADGTGLQLYAEFVGYLEGRYLIDCGSNFSLSRTAEIDSDDKMGLTLDWLYNNKQLHGHQSHQAAKVALGQWQPTVQEALRNLQVALADQHTWQKTAQELSRQTLDNIMDSRKEYQQLKEQYLEQSDVSSACPADLPDEVIIKLLKREEMLINARLAALEHEQLVLAKRLQFALEDANRVSVIPSVACSQMD